MRLLTLRRIHGNDLNLFDGCDYSPSDINAETLNNFFFIKYSCYDLLYPDLEALKQILAHVTKAFSWEIQHRWYLTNQDYAVFETEHWKELYKNDGTSGGTLERETGGTDDLTIQEGTNRTLDTTGSESVGTDGTQDTDGTGHEEKRISAFNESTYQPDNTTDTTSNQHVGFSNQSESNTEGNEQEQTNHNRTDARKVTGTQSDTTSGTTHGEGEKERFGRSGNNMDLFEKQWRTLSHSFYEWLAAFYAQYILLGVE